jgi:hypothetical protein
MTIDVLFQFNLFLVSKKMLGFFFLVLQLQPSLIFRSTQKKTTFCYVIYTYREIEEFDRAVKLVISQVTFDTDIVVSVFETNIRVLGYV